MPDSIWDMAIDQQKQREITSPANNSQKHKESSLLIVGSKGVGKTTLIQRLLERQEAAKPTLALEYTYGRRTNQSLAKVLCSCQGFFSSIGGHCGHRWAGMVLLLLRVMSRNEF